MKMQRRDLIINNEMTDCSWLNIWIGEVLHPTYALKCFSLFCYNPFVVGLGKWEHMPDNSTVLIKAFANTGIRVQLAPAEYLAAVSCAAQCQKLVLRKQWHIKFVGAVLTELFVSWNCRRTRCQDTHRCKTPIGFNHGSKKYKVIAGSKQDRTLTRRNPWILWTTLALMKNICIRDKPNCRIITSGGSVLIWWLKHSEPTGI